MDKQLTVRWFPAAWILLEYDGYILYIDTAWVQHNFAKHPGKIIYTHYPEPMDGLPEPDMPKADVILVTHNHQDHIKTATLHRLVKDSTKIIAPKNCSNLIDLLFAAAAPGDKFAAGPFTITATYAYNTSEGHSTHKPHKRGECIGYIVEVGGKRIYHAGDTDVIPEMNELGELDAAFLPVGGTFTMDLAEAVTCAESIKPCVFIPMHYLHVSREQAEQTLKSSPLTYAVPKIGERLQI